MKSVNIVTFGLDNTPSKNSFDESPFEKNAIISPLRSFNIVIGHSLKSFGLGARNLTWTSTIFKGYKQNIVSTFGCTILLALDI